jgi:endoglucanase
MPKPRVIVLACAAALSVAAALAPAGALAGVANSGVAGAPRSNPLAGLRWGHSTGDLDNVYTAYASARGRDRRLLAKIALRPIAEWFGDWYGDSYVGQLVRGYIRSVTHGNRDVLTQLTVFRMDPWEGDACNRLPSPRQQSSYGHWLASLAAGIGSSRVALILQPDMPFALCAPGGSQLPLRMVAYAAERLSRLPHTTVYIDAGAAEWLPPSRAALMLEHAGVRHTRGFALNATQAVSTAMSLDYGASIVSQLNADGVTGKHFVINTAQNGSPFLFGQYPGDPNRPRVCASRHDRLCLTLGIPPTWHTAGWGLPARESRLAARLADGYLWFGRPWLNFASTAFDRARALGLAATTPY